MREGEREGGREGRREKVGREEGYLKGDRRGAGSRKIIKTKSNLGYIKPHMI